MARAGFVCAASLCALLAGCAPAPGPAANLTMADISPILTPLTYREMLGAKCGEPNMEVKSEFMTDLKAAGATETLMTEVGAEAGRIEAAERDTPNEYVCTAELYESTEENADAAQKAWAELKNRKS